MTVKEGYDAAGRALSPVGDALAPVSDGIVSAVAPFADVAGAGAVASGGNDSRGLSYVGNEVADDLKSDFKAAAAQAGNGFVRLGDLSAAAAHSGAASAVSLAQ